MNRLIQPPTGTLRLLLLAVLVAVGLAPAAHAQSSNGGEADRQELLQNYSLYYEAFKSEDWRTAWQFLEPLLETSPGFTGRDPDDRNVRRAVDVLANLAQQAEDPAQKQAYYEQALDLLDNAPSILQDAGVDVNEADWIRRKGRFLQDNAEALADMQGEVYDLYVRAFELDPTVLGDYYLNYIAAERVRRVAETGTPAEKVATREFLQNEIVPRLENAEAKTYVEDTLMPSLITTPREQYGFLKERYETDPESLSEDELVQLFELNQNPELNDQALAQRLLPVILELDPTPGRLVAAARSVQADDPDQAVTYFEQALELAEEDDMKRDIYYNSAVMKEEQGQYAPARNYANQALEIDANHAPSLYLIGGLISRSVGGGDARARAGYWCAADQYNRAARAAREAGNEPLASAAGSAAAQSNRAAPNSEEYFFLGWQPGQSISASYGWGSCTTTVR